MKFTMVYRGKSQNSPSIQAFHLFKIFTETGLSQFCDNLWHSQRHFCDHFCSQRVEKLVYYEKMSSYWDLLTYYIIHLWIIYCIFVVQWYRNTLIRVKVPSRRLSYSFLIRWLIWSSDSSQNTCPDSAVTPKLDPNLTQTQPDSKILVFHSSWVEKLWFKNVLVLD